MPASPQELRSLEETLNARAEELDRKTAALDARIATADEADRNAAQLARELADRKDDLDARSAKITIAEASAHRETIASNLPDDVGVAVIQLDLDVVAVLAALHPSEQGSIANRVNGTIREALIETRKLRPVVGYRDRRPEPLLGPTYAEVIPARVDFTDE